MILVDANLLIYAVDRDAPHHAAARKWVEGAFSGPVTVALSWGVILAFLRLTTRPGILRRPMPPETALEYIDEWLSLPTVEAIVPGDRRRRHQSKASRSQNAVDLHVFFSCKGR